MNDRMKNPHTFDMSNYFTGQTYIIGGRDFDRDETKNVSDDKTAQTEKKIELDWSFLRKNLRKSSRK